MANTYIIYSPLIDKYYIGACYQDLQKRIKNHNLGKYGSKTFTAQTQDWKLFLSFQCADYSHAVRLERKIKSMKSRKYILNLLKYPELRNKVLAETKNT
jgi:putative endonuclease